MPQDSRLEFLAYRGVPIEWSVDSKYTFYGNSKSFAESKILFLKIQFFKLMTLFSISLGLEISNDTHIIDQFERYCWNTCVRKFEKKN